MIEETICDLCGQSSYTTIYEGNINPEEDVEGYFSSSRIHAGHWPIVKCTNCGLHRSNPRDKQDTIQSVYEQLTDEIYDDEEMNRAFIAKKRVNEICHIKKTGQLLDIGCSTGIFAYEASKRSWHVTGIDPSDWAIIQAKNRVKGGKFAISTIENAEFQLKSFDLITLWDVLEHVTSPTTTLMKVNQWLVDDGLVVLNIPNINSLFAKAMKKNWVLFLREHLWYFDPHTITQLLLRTGFEVISIKSNYVRFSLKNIFTRISQYPTLKLFQQLSKIPGFQIISINFPIGEMKVYARKSTNK